MGIVGLTAVRVILPDIDVLEVAAHSCDVISVGHLVDAAAAILGWPRNSLGLL